ncbi:MAG: aminoglycoside phosphotransferase family protein [Bdellovibrio sp.]|nr:aminoglycoside phosphotransferase family protein [Bdellovibrio sp.]
MEWIPPKERFNHHEQTGSISLELVQEAVAKFGLNPAESTIRRLSGGFMNTNYLVAEGSGSYVFRFYSTDRVTAEREKDVLSFLKSSSVLVPGSFGGFEVQGRAFGVIEFIDGMTLEDRILEGDIDMSVFEQIGTQLAHIHNIRFSEAGFIGPHMKLGREYVHFGIFIRQFIERTLLNLRDKEERLDAETSRRFSSLVQDKWDLVVRSEIFHELVHTDFNPKNILVSKKEPTQVLGVIDWEFCLAGNGLMDLGNFFRFEYDYPPGARDVFAQGYRSISPNLTDNWVEVSKLLDLGSMCSFLERPEDYQKSFRTARAVVRSTLEYFGY